VKLSSTGFLFFVLLFIPQFLNEALSVAETSLERFLGVGSLSLCASTVPETFVDPAEVTYLSLADCGLTTVPEKIGLDFLLSFFFSIDSDSLELQPLLSM